MTAIELHTDKPKAAALLLFLVGLLAFACYTVLTAGSSVRAEIAGWLSIPTLGPLAVVLASQLLAQGPAVLITSRGIEDRRYGWKVPWEEVRDIRADTFEAFWFSRKYLRIQTRRSEECYSTVPPNWSARIHQAWRRADQLFAAARLGIDFGLLNEELGVTHERIRGLGFLDETKGAA